MVVAAVVVAVVVAFHATWVVSGSHCGCKQELECKQLTVDLVQLVGRLVAGQHQVWLLQSMNDVKYVLIIHCIPVYIIIRKHKTVWYESVQELHYLYRCYKEHEKECLTQPTPTSEIRLK